MTDPTPAGVQYPTSLLEALLADIDACRAGEQTAETRAALHEMEGKLASVSSLYEGDIFTLMGRLDDRRLSAGTRERIAQNLARSAPYSAARWRRVETWLIHREENIARHRDLLGSTLEHTDKAIGLLAVAQASLKSMEATPFIKGLLAVIENARDELAIACISQEGAIDGLNAPDPVTQQVIADDISEAALFCEARNATVQ